MSNELTDEMIAEADAAWRKDMLLIDELRARITQLLDEFFRKQMPTWTINRPSEFSFGLVVPSPHEHCMWVMHGPDIAGVKQATKFMHSLQQHEGFLLQGIGGAMGMRGGPLPSPDDDEPRRDH